MYHVLYWLYLTTSMQINIVIGGKPPNPLLKSYFINQLGIKYMVGDSAVLLSDPCQNPSGVSQILKNPSGVSQIFVRIPVRLVRSLLESQWDQSDHCQNPSGIISDPCQNPSGVSEFQWGSVRSLSESQRGQSDHCQNPSGVSQILARIPMGSVRS